MSLDGTLTWITNKDVHLEVAYDKIALAETQLTLLSAVGYTQDIKAIRAGLNSQLRTPMKLEGPRLVDGEKERQQDHALGVLQGYQTYFYRLGYDVVHAIYVARVPGLLFNGGDDALWQELCPPPSASRPARYQTPMLRHWVPYIRRELVQHEKRLLRPCACHGCSVWYLSATTQDLDDIVSAGLKSGEIKIEECAA